MIRKIEADERQPSMELAYLLADALQIPSEQRELFVEVARRERPLATLVGTWSSGGVAERWGREAKATIVQTNLPPQPTPFIGREQELAELAALLAEENSRLITLVGIGGMGKTRLALAFAERLIESLSAESFPFPDGIYFINLTPLSDVAHIIPTLAESVNFPLQGGRREQRSPRQQILDYLLEKQMLLIVDNFEHMLAGTEFIMDILQTATGVQMIVTSRERLHLRQEQVYPIQGLEFPDWEIASIDNEDSDAAAYSAGRLFLQSAQRNRPDFQLADGDDLTYLARICRLVAGMPLAIELAASWVDMLSLSEIAQEIRASLDFLETEMRDVPERHRSIRAAIDTSWQKLTDNEKEIFAQLSVFRGGFTRRAGQTVTTASLRLMSRLVAKSFLQYDPERRRYQIHEMMRQYGAEKLAADKDSATAVSQRHSRYYCQALAERTSDLRSQRQKEAIAEIELDIENARAAWRWAARSRDAASLDQALSSLFRFYEWNGRYQDYESSANEAIARLNQPQATPLQLAVLAKLLHLKLAQTLDTGERQKLIGQTRSLLDQLIQMEVEVSALLAEDLFCQAQFQMEEGDYRQAERTLRSSIDYFQQSREPWQEAKAWRTWSISAARQGEFQRAEEYGQRALVMARKLGDRRQMALALHDLGFNANNQGHFGAMRQYMEEALEIARDLGQIPLQGLMLMEIGTSYVTEGQPAEAIRYHQKGLAILRRAGDRQRVAWTIQLLAWDHLALEDVATAEYWLREGDVLAKNLQNARVSAFFLVTHCWSALMQGRYDEALIHAEEAATGIGSSAGVDVLAFVLVTMGWVQLVHEQGREAEKNLHEALQIKNVLAREALLPIAYLLVRHRPITESVKRAWQLIGLSEQTSLLTSWSLFNAFADRFQPPELFELPPVEIEAAKTYGRTLDPDTVTSDLIEELPKLGWET